MATKQTTPSARPTLQPANPTPAADERFSIPAESRRLAADAQRLANWKRWGPYLSERQWGTVREDYSPDGSCWSYFSHDHARSRAYRWGEDGLLGISDRECRLCFALAVWNGRDPIIKERLFGLTGPEGNCAEDVKEHYFYIDSTPTHSYMKALYKYPIDAFPYATLAEQSRTRSRADGEFELADTGVFDHGHYFDVQAEYAKAGPDDLLIRITVTNRSTQEATLHLLPTLWFRNTWSWGRTHEGYEGKPDLKARDEFSVVAEHPTLGTFRWFTEKKETPRAASAAPGPRKGASAVAPAHAPTLLFTENDTNLERLYNTPNPTPYVKDAFDRYLVHGEPGAVNPARRGTKVAAHYPLTLPPGTSQTVRLRLNGTGKTTTPPSAEPLGPEFDRIFATRLAEADEFYAASMPRSMPDERKVIARQAYAGLLWSKQFFYYVVDDWLKGDPSQPPPPASRGSGRNNEWRHLFNRDIISMPDKWEYPWYAAWDLAFHMIAFAQLDPTFAKDQLLLFLREWYMHPNGQIPAYEFAFGDVNPPVHAWACWRVYKITAPPGHRDRAFLERAFQKLLINFTWWVNRKDPDGKNVFGGGFLGLDNIGVFDRSRPLPTGGTLAQADGTAWMAFYCGTMLSIALELALENPAYEDIASKFFEHFIAITDAINTLGGNGLWDDQDGFYYDQLVLPGKTLPLRVRSLVGILPIMAIETIHESTIDALPGFKKRMQWFLDNRPDLAGYTSYCVRDDKPTHAHRLLAIPTAERLRSVLRYVLDENEFLSPFGVRSLSKHHKNHPYIFRDDASGNEYRVDYTPGESTTGLFGGNSNWRGPIWFPLNYLLIESLERYHRFYGNAFQIDCPTGSGKACNLAEVADHLRERLATPFLPGKDGKRPFHQGDRLLDSCPHSKDLILFHEYFHGDTGRGLGANHQTGWTGLIAPLLADVWWRVDKQDSKSAS
ncbi:MAG: MGH1-like glycoside hydrolase domain-containing protein [Phycisphaerales bacterium]